LGPIAQSSVIVYGIRKVDGSGYNRVVPSKGQKLK